MHSTLRAPRGLFIAAAMIVTTVTAGYGSSARHAPPDPIELAQAGGTERPELQPRYQPVPPEEKGWYNSSYIFGLTRGVADSTMHPAAKAPLYFLTLPLDLAFLPFATIGGLFG